MHETRSKWSLLPAFQGAYFQHFKEPRNRGKNLVPELLKSIVNLMLRLPDPAYQDTSMNSRFSSRKSGPSTDPFEKGDSRRGDRNLRNIKLHSRRLALVGIDRDPANVETLQ